MNECLYSQQTDVNSSRKHSDRVETRPPPRAHSIINRDVITPSRYRLSLVTGVQRFHTNHPWLFPPATLHWVNTIHGVSIVFERRAIRFNALDKHGSNGKVHVALKNRWNNAPLLRGHDHLRRFKGAHYHRRSQSAPDNPTNSSAHRVLCTEP